MSPLNFRTALRAVLFLGLLTSLGLVYAWFSSKGLSVEDWPRYSDQFVWLGRGFLQGKTHMACDPPQELLDLPDPYDPSVNQHLIRYDASLYNGKYHLYWGPVPALATAFADVCLGFRYMTDNFIVLVFFCGLLVFNALLVLEIRRQCFPGFPIWTTVLPILILALAHPIPYILSCAGVYEAAIITSQCFLMGGVYFALSAFRADKPHWPRLWIASCFWAVAIGARVSVAAAIALMMLIALVRANQSLRRWNRERTGIVPLTLFALPIAAAGLALGLYNQARFGSFFEPGMRYQLGPVHMPTYMQGKAFQMQHVPSSTYSFLLRPPRFLHHFPYLETTSYFPDFLRPPEHYVLYPVAGILRVAPIAWLALIPVCLGIAWFWNYRKSSESDKPIPHILWFAATLLAGASAILPSLMVFGFTERYSADATSAIYLLGILGFFHLVQSARGLLVRCTCIAFTSSIAVATIAFGVLLGYCHPLGFAKYNPDVFDHMAWATIPSWNPVYIADIHNRNGIEGSGNQEFFWLGDGDTSLQLMSRRAGTVAIKAFLSLGPRSPYPDRARFLIQTDGGFRQTVELSPGAASIIVPTVSGRTKVTLTPLDQPLPDPGISNDKRPLILRVENLGVEACDEIR